MFFTSKSIIALSFRSFLKICLYCDSYNLLYDMESNQILIKKKLYFPLVSLMCLAFSSLSEESSIRTILYFIIYRMHYRQ